MDLASLITPGPDPLPKARASYNPVAPITGKRCAEDSYFSTTYSRSPQPPLSPPVDDQPTKCSLPSISYLLNDAEAHEAKRQRLSPPRRESDPRTHYDAISAHGPHVNLPPTPPLRPESGFHSTVHSPSASSVSAVKPDSYPPVPVTLHSPTDRSSISSQGSTIHHHHHHHSAAYASPAPSVASYSSPVETTFYPQQRPGSSSTTAAFHHSSAPVPAAPAAAATTPAAATLPSSQQMISPVTPAWQHHHYFPPSTSAPYQQNHDRYICRTCHKAFSRPSSLRIHSHSHTGEKPFRCTHVGCGKAFSVRSNMKRHERGCHSGRPVAAAMV